MTKATNDNVSVTATYDGAGNSTGTRLQKSGKAGVYLQTSATYTANQDHTASVTDANGGTTTFGYDSLGRNTSTSTPIDTGVTSTTSYTYVSGTDWQYRTSNSSGAVLYYGDTNGVQTEASRYSSNSQARPWQPVSPDFGCIGGTPPRSKSKAALAQRSLLGLQAPPWPAMSMPGITGICQR